MKKTGVFLTILSVVVVLVLVLGSVRFVLQKDRQEDAVAQAEASQLDAHEQYLALRANVQATTLTVTENGKTIGVYDLAQLGLLDKALSDADSCFGQPDRVDPAEFAALAPEDKLVWESQAQRQRPVVTLSEQLLDVSGVLLDLAKEIRYSAKNAYAYFENGAYAIEPETAGTMLNNEVVARALQLAMTGYVVTADAPGQITFEVSDCDPYLTAEVTAAEGKFDYAALLQRDAEGVTIPVSLLDKTENLQVSQVISVDENGVVRADRAALEQIVAGWAAVHQGEDVPFILDSYVEGPVAIDFINCTYELDQAALVRLLETQAILLDGTTVKAPYLCYRRGELFTLGDHYVEVDVENQVMTYYKDGQVLVTTDVVTGYPWGHWTPPGLYAVQNKDVDCWLSGPDYNVFVKYWVGFQGAYGIHDASWRTIFGGKKYLSDGSHGCVNTPEEAMRLIHENIEVGVPVIVHDVIDK